MILELAQLYDMFNGRFHALIFFFILFVVTPSIIFRYYSNKYRPYINDSNISTNDVTIIYPLLKENPDIIKKSLMSIYQQCPKDIIVVYDGKGKELDVIYEIKEIQDKLKIIKFENRVGKRRVISAGIKSADSEFILLLDSDTILLGDNFLIEMLKPMNDKNIVSVSPISTVYRTGSYLTFKMSQLIERSRGVINKSLNEGLVVAYGSCALWRRNILIEKSEKYINQRFLGRPFIIGEDRFLTREAEKSGYKTVVQSTAHIDIASPPTLISYIRQQIRWARSGMTYFILDLKERNVPSKLFLYHCMTYYLAPIFFLISILSDIFIFSPVYDLSFLTSIVAICIGVTTVTMFRAKIKLDMNMRLQDALICGLLGLFVMFPIILYGHMTIYKQVWIQTNVH